MREYVARLIRSGMPRDIALCICRNYVKRKDWEGLEEYVYSVEMEAIEREEDEL